MSIEIGGPAWGASYELEGTSSGTYNAQVKGYGSGTWSSALTVKTGVTPGDLSTSPDSDRIEFSWDGDANASGYRVDATKVQAADWSSECSTGDDKNLYTNSFKTGKDWMYIGTTYKVSSGDSGGSVDFTPRYISPSAGAGQYLAGRPGLGIESKPFPIAGAESIELSYTILAWNLDNKEMGRVDAYYKLDDGPWHFLGTGTPTGTSNGNTSGKLSFTLTGGQLDGTNITFKIVAPNAAVVNYSGSRRLGGPGIQALRVDATAPADGGAYTTHVSGYPKVVSGTSETVTGLSEGDDVYFRVQALQGSDTANPDARSVWVETKETAAPALSPQTTAVGVTDDTFTWNTTYDTAGGIQLTGSGGNGTTGSAYSFSLVSSTIADSGSVSSSGFLSVTKAGGTFTVAVTHTADGYESRTDNVTITVNKGSQTITGLSSSYTKDYGSGTFTLSATSGSGLAVSYNIPAGSSGVATVSGSTVTVVGVGTATITASQAGNNLWNAAPNKTATLTVRAVNPTVTSGSVTDITATSATLKGTVTALGGAASLSAAGAAYMQATSGSPTITDNLVASASSPVAGTEFSATATGLTPGTPYRWRAYGTTSESKTGYGSAATFYTKCDTPTAPSGLTVAQLASGAVTSKLKLTWTVGALGTGGGTLYHLILRSTNPSASGTPTDGTVYSAGATIGDWTVAAVKSASTTTFTDEGLNADTVYYYKVYSYAVVSSQNGTCAYSATGATGNNYTKSEALSAAWSPTITTVPGGRSAEVSWTPTYNSGAGFDGYLIVIEQKTGSTGVANLPTDGTVYDVGDSVGSGGAYVACKVTDPTATSATITGLTLSKHYRAELYAYDGDHYRVYKSGGEFDFDTTSVAGPETWATGVDGTSFLLNWSKMSSDTAGYDVKTGSGTPVVLLDEGFTTSGGWQTAAAATGPKTAASGVWQQSSVGVTATANDNDSCANPTYNVTTANLEFPPLTGTVTRISAVFGATDSYTTSTKGLLLQYYDGSTWQTLDTWTANTFSSSSARVPFEYVPATPIAANGLRLRLYHWQTGNNQFTVLIYHVRVEGSMATGVEGYSKVIDGLTSGTTYTAQVRKSPNGEWSDSLSVKAGVKPNTPSGSAVRNAVTFTWTDAQSGASGYMVDATTTDQAWANKTCPSAALTLGSFGTGQDWKYTGTTATSSDGTVKSAPTYSTSGDDGHFLVGRAGNAIESKAFAIAGATGLKLTFTVEAWNLGGATAGIEAGRVNAYYKTDAGEWCFFGTALPSGTADNSSAAVTLNVPAGALDGDEIAFRLVAVKAEGAGGSYLRGPYINNLKVQSTSVGAGYYGANSLSDFPRLATSAEVSAKSVTISGLTAGQSVGFRVQALQGSTANPTAKSVWVEATGTATAYTPPSGLTLTGVTRNGMTATWVAGDTTDLDHYVVEWSTSSSFATLAGSQNVAAGTLTYAIPGLTASTKYYVRVKAVGTDSQSSAYCDAANATTSGFSGPATVTASGETRNGMTLTWDAVAGAASYRVEWTPCSLDSDTPVQEGTTCPSSTRAYDTHSTTDWTYRKGYSSSAGYAAGAYPYWHGDAFGHWLGGQYVNTTYKPGVETPDLDLSDAKSGYIEFAHRKANDGTNTLSKFSPVTLYYSLDGGAGWTNVSSSTAGTGSWVTKTIDLPSVVLGRKNVRLQLRADKAAAYYDTSVSAYKPAGAGIKDIKVYKVKVGGDYECAGADSDTASGTTMTLTGLNPETLYHFRVIAIGSGDGAESTPTAGSSSTTAFLGPAVSVTGNTRYTLTAGWEAYAGESGYTTSYEVQRTGCGNAESLSESCPAQNLDWGSSATAWTYQREYSGSTASSYPKYGDGVHKLWGQFSYTSTEPGILSPELDLAGYASASVEFTHMYVNRANMSGVTLEYSLNEGSSWTEVASTGNAAGATLATASSRTIALPAEALTGGVKLRLRTTHATNYDADPDVAVTNYMVQGASIANLAVVAVGTGGGNYKTSGEGACDSVSAVIPVASGTTYTFEGLEAGKSYFVRVRTVLTPAGGGAAEKSSWSEASGMTGAPQNPPEEVWAEDVKQRHMTIAWDEVDGATATTKYQLQVASCKASDGDWTETAVQPSATNAMLGAGDDWEYIGGGTPVAAVASGDGAKASEATYITTAEATYPAWADYSTEMSQVLAGEGEPGLESAEFSTIGATGGTLTFGHGRWYAGTAALAEHTKLSLFYSTDGGSSWTFWRDTPTVEDKEFAYNNVVNYTLPAAALGHAHAKLRIVATNACITPSDGTGHAVGAAVTAARVTLTGAHGDYSSCLVTAANPALSTGTATLTAEQLSLALEGLTKNTTYYYRVRASDGLTSPAQYGAWVEGAAKTLDAPDEPETPWAVNIGRHTMTIRWNPVAGAETYTVKVYSNAGCTTEVDGEAGLVNTEWNVTGLGANTPYWFRVSAQADGESSGWSAIGNTEPVGKATTVEGLSVTGLRAEDILDTSMTLKWDWVGDTTYTLHWGEASASGSVTLNQDVECPASTLKRNDAGNKWFYFGGSASYPKYYTSSTQPTTDHGHVLINTGGGQPGIQSRWFSTYDASAAYVMFNQGRYGAGSDSSIQVDYSIDGGVTWATAGLAPSAGDAATVPNVARSIALPGDALGRKSVMVRLTATGADGNKGAQLNDIKVRVVTGEAGAYTTVEHETLDDHPGELALTGLKSGKRYWFEMFAEEVGVAERADAHTTAATRTNTTGVVKSQGFEGLDNLGGALDARPLSFAAKWCTVGSSSVRTVKGSGDPDVSVVAGENPLYGDRALRLSGSAAGNAFGVAEFDTGAIGGMNTWVATIPFAVGDLASGENIWVSYSTDGGTTWQAPNGLTTRNKEWGPMGKIGYGGSDVMNQNWPYNRGYNKTTRPGGNPFTFAVTNAARLTIRVAFCGGAGGASHHVYLDGVTLTRQPGTPTHVDAEAQDNGKMELTWTPPQGCGVVILRGRDERHVPASPVDIENLPFGYELVINPETGTAFWPNPQGEGTPVSQSYEDPEVLSGWKYYYYFYGALVEDGVVTLGTTPAMTDAPDPHIPNDVVKGMVNAIASQGWDGWDVHPWGYKKGRLTNPYMSTIDSDYGWWRLCAGAEGSTSAEVKWYDNYETDADGRSPTYASLYGAGGTYAPKSDGDEPTEQLGVTSFTNYYGDHCFRLSGGGSYRWTPGGGAQYFTKNWDTGEKEWHDIGTAYINTNNAAIEFDNVDLSGYKNVELTMHFAGQNLNGGNDLHVIISTNAGTTWEKISNKDGWKVMEYNREYGLTVSDGNTKLGGQWDFYFEDYDLKNTPTPYGNPVVWQVPDNVTQLAMRVVFYDSNGSSLRRASYYIDEVRLLGEKAMEDPHPVLTEITKNSMTAEWEAVPGASGYNVKLTACENPGLARLEDKAALIAQGFVLNVFTNGWTTNSANGHQSLIQAANRRGSGYGLALTGVEGWAASPSVGAAHTMTFWVKTTSADSGKKMAVEALADGATDWETLKEYDAGATGMTTMHLETVELPRRQWQKVRFRQTTTASCNWHIDDVTIYGGGNYESCSEKLVSQTTTGTSYTFTGLDAGTEYFVEVQAYGSPAGYLAYSEWVETADYTPGTFEVASDGFEMTRSTWGATASASEPFLLMAVNDGKAFSEVLVPTGDPAVGTTFGEGVVIAKSSGGQSAPGFEHVVPHGARTEARDQKYVAYWKHGSYWEGRLETNVVLGTYICQAADAMAITNATAVPAGTQGKGWGAGWKPWDADNAKANPDYISVLRDATTESGYTYYGLVGSNKLAGAGGNAIRFDMGADRNLRLARALSAPVEDGEVWIMFTVRSQYGGDNDGKMFGLQLSSGTDATTAGGGIFASIGNLYGRYGDGDARGPGLQIGTTHSGTWPSAYGEWDTSDNGAPYMLHDTDNHSPAEDRRHTIVVKYDVSHQKIYAMAMYTPSVGVITASKATTGALAPNSDEPDFHCEATLSSKQTLGTIILMGKGYNGNLDFDEVRVGGSWEDIVGKETEAPFPVTGAEAWTDGNELVRIGWTYADEGTDTSVTPNVERPLASGVRIYAREGTSGEWTEIYKGTGTNEAAVAAGAGSRWDHVVAPGSTHQYKVEAYASGKTAPAVDAVLKDSAPASYDVTTGVYGDTEYVNPFSYTNGTSPSATAGYEWKGGHGFENGSSDKFYWSVPNDSAGTWSVVTPEAAQEVAHITNVVTGAKLVAGNVLKVSGLADGQTASINRQLSGSSWCGNVGSTFYVSYRLAYKYRGPNRQAGLYLIDDKSTANQVFVGKIDGGDWHTIGVNATAYYGGGNSSDNAGAIYPYDGRRDDEYSYNGSADNAYLIVMRVKWLGDDRVDAAILHYQIGNNGSLERLPDSEPPDSDWHTWQNARLKNVRKIQLLAKGEIGDTFFDDIRFGTKWDDIVGATEPEDAWTVEGAKSTGYYLGDFVTWPFKSWPKGLKQSSWVSLSTSPSFPAGASTKTNGTEWVDNEAGAGGKQNTIWRGLQLQLWQTGNMYAGGSVKGELVTKNSWERTPANGTDGKYRYDTYTVTPLPAPKGPLSGDPAVAAEHPTAVGGAAKITVSWSPAKGTTTDGTANGRTFAEVMVVRFPGSSASWSPVQGTTYMKGDTVGGTGTVLYRGTAETTLVDKGLQVSTEGNPKYYTYQFYTVNNSYYSPAETVTEATSTDNPEIEVDGDPSDWVGEPSPTKNSSTCSSSEFIWTDKVGEGRVDKDAALDADMKEFRIKVDNAGNVYFLMRLNRLSNLANPYIAVGISTNVDATRLAPEGNEAGDNWLGDEGNTFMGDNLFEPASLHYADIQMTVHQVGGVWKIELWKKDGSAWYTPSGEGTDWKVASSAANAADPCIEWKIPRSVLGLDYASMTPARFTVASFVNANGWNNDVDGTVKLSDGTSRAVDALAIAPWGQNDKDLALSAWEEGLKAKNAEYWFDLWFGPTAVHNHVPAAPEYVWLNYDEENPTARRSTQDLTVGASPVMSWSQAADVAVSGESGRGFVVGYLIEVTTNALFNGLEGTTENGPVSCRINLEGAETTSYQYITDSREYWWRVRSRDNSGTLSPATAWHYVVQGKTDNAGPEPRLLYVGTQPDLYVSSTPAGLAYRHEQDMSGDATSVLDSELEDGGHTFGFVIEWYDASGVYATNHFLDSASGKTPTFDTVFVSGKTYYKKSGADYSTASHTADGNPASEGLYEDVVAGSGFAFNTLAELAVDQGGGVSSVEPYGRVSPNWDLIIVDRSAPDDGPQPADEVVGGKHYEYTRNLEDGLTVPTDDGGKETVHFWYIDCGLDRVFNNSQTINAGNSGKQLTNYVKNAFSIGSYRPSLDIYLTVSAEDCCTNAEYSSTAWYTWPSKDGSGNRQYSAGNGPQQGDRGSWTSSGWCADGPNPSRNVTTNRLLHIHVRDNDTTPPVTSQAKWRSEAAGDDGRSLLPMMAVTSGGDANPPTGWNPTWTALGAQGRVPTLEGQGKALEWQLTDADVSTYTHATTAGGTGTQTWRGSAKPIRLFFNLYDDYLHSGLASFTAYSARPTASDNPPTCEAGAAQTGTYVSKADNSRILLNTGLLLGGEWSYFRTADETVNASKTYYTLSGGVYSEAASPSSTENLYERRWSGETNWAGFAPGWSKITQYPWEEATGNNVHGWGTGPDSVLAWQLDASEANVTNLLRKDNILTALGSGSDANGAIVFTNDVKLSAMDNDNNAGHTEGPEGATYVVNDDQEGAELTFGRLLFSDDDATPPEMPGFLRTGTGTNYTHFGELAKWTWGTDKDDVTQTTKMGAIRMGDNATGKQSSTSLTPESDSPAEVKWNSSKNAIYMQGNMNATTYRAANSKYFQFQMGGDGTTTWRTDMIGFWSRVSPTGPTKFTLTVQGTAGTAYPAVSGGSFAEDGTHAAYWTTDYCTATNGKVGTRDNIVVFRKNGGNGTATLTSKPISCSGIANLFLNFEIGRWDNANNRQLIVEYHLSGEAEGTWHTLRTFDGTSTGDFTAGTALQDKWLSYSYNFAVIPNLMDSSQTVTVRLSAGKKDTSSSSGGLTATYGFVVSELKLTAGGNEGSERWLGDIVIEKNIATTTVTTAGEEQTAGSYANTETSVILGFDGLVEGYDNLLQTFRLYGYGATHMDANTGEIDTSDTSQGTWAIKDLYIHGTASEVTPELVTDYDITHGTWTNRLEALDGAMAGYDTAVSGLRIYDATNASTGARAEWSGEAPAFRILYPTYYDGTSGKEIPNGDANAVVTSGELLVRAVAKAAYATITDPDFDSATGWMLLNDASIANSVLTLPGNGEVSSASRSFEVTPPDDLESVTIAGTVSAKGTLGGVNTLTVTVQPCSDTLGETAIGDPLTTDITTTSRPKNFAVGPWSLDLTTVRSVKVTVAQSSGETTAMTVDSLNVYAAQWGHEISAEKASDADAWAANVTNGMPGAKILMRTPEIDLSEVDVPIFLPSESGTQNRHYRLQGTLFDYDKDRAGDALGTSAVTNFFLYDDDRDAPQFGSKYGGPLGVFLNGTIVPQGWRTGITEGSENSKLNQKWPIVDSELTKLAPAAPVMFALSFYDFSGWSVTDLLLGSDTIVSGGAIPTGAGSAYAKGWRAPEDNDGAEDSPGATSTWSIGAKQLYDAYKASFDDTSSDTGVEMKALVWDNDHDRRNDALSFSDGGAAKRVGYVWFTDQDVRAPEWGVQADLYSGVMISTNVPPKSEVAEDDGYAKLLAQTTGEGNAPYALGGLANNQMTQADGKTPDFTGRSYLIYDGELHDNVTASGQFVITANITDPQDGYSAHKAAGLQRGSALTAKRAMWGDNAEAPTDPLNQFTVTNTYLVLTNADAGTAVTNVAWNNGYSEAVSKTRVSSQAGHTSWTWSSFPVEDIGLLLPGEEASVQVVIEAFDADMDRHNDQKHATLFGPTITLRDDDTKNPDNLASTTMTLGGVNVHDAWEGADGITRENAKWYNAVTLSQWQLQFQAVEDGLPNANDLGPSGVALDGYRMMKRTVAHTATEGTAWQASEDIIQLATSGSTNVGSTITATLSSAVRSALEQGMTTQLVFAVDADDDRTNDALAGTGVAVPLAYDNTPPTPVPMDNATGASTDDVSDPTTQMKLTWNPSSVGPDDNRTDAGAFVDENYAAIPSAIRTASGAVANELLSPWETYKVYYRTYDESTVTANIYGKYISGDKYKTGVEAALWTSVTKDTPIVDSTATTDYDDMHLKATEGVTLYDLDFDQHYLFVVVGVDKAGNEGPATSTSWATNNTIKFAVTQGVVKASAAINADIGELANGKQTNTVGMAKINTTAAEGYTPPTRGVVLYWKAAGLNEDEETHQLKGKVTKEYDLIFRYADSFSENGTEQWMMATGGAAGDNSGTSMTNWNYQADTNLTVPNRMRFYRASYHNRWQDKKPGTQENQYPLASEEVYSMNNVVLSEGFNYVSLQGVPYTNTFRGVFGAQDLETWPETEEWRKDVEQTWPGGESAADITNGATVIEFFGSGTDKASIGVEWYFYGKDGHWYNGDNGDDVTDTPQSGEFFMRPFSINLPNANVTTNDDGVVTTNGWWKDHTERMANYGSREVRAMLWHPILQVPTNGVVEASSEASPSAGTTARDGTGGSGLVFKQTIRRGKGVYNTLSFNLPVAVNPGDLGLVAFGTDGKPTSEKMKAGAPQDKKTDKLYVIDTVSKEVRGNTTMYCDGNGDWRYNSNRALVTGNVIKPNDMIVLISGEKESGAADEWIWEYKPADFYAPPNRHMGRDRQ